MAIREYAVTLKGMTPLLMHCDDVEWADEMKAWSKDPNNKEVSVAGDDRSPAWRWLGSVYHDDTRVVIPAENIQKALLEGAAGVLTGKGTKTFKAQSQSGMALGEPCWPLKARGKELAWTALVPLQNEPSFGLHIAATRELGFRLFTKRAKVAQSKHVRVRPRFDEWSASGSIRVWDDQITHELVMQFFKIAGRYKGIGDWRPSSPKSPGPFGMFEASVKVL